MWIRTSAAAVALAFGIAVASAAGAATYIYNLVGSLTSNQATGTITTDTNSGVVAFSNILSWNITVDAGSGAENLNTSTSQLRGNFSNGVRATASGLFFDFSGSPTQYMQFVDSSNNQVTYCSGLPGCMAGYEQATVSANGAGSSFYYTGSQQIASIAPGGVPEPATWALMISGFGLAGASLRRRRNAAVCPF